MTREETQITWNAATSKSVGQASTETSDAFTFNAGCWDAAIQLSADNDGSPAAGDLIEFRILYTNGDILGDSGDDFDTAEHAALIAVLDTWASSTPGEDPARLTVPLPTMAAKGFMLRASNKSTGRAITVRARVVELVGAIS